MKDLKDRLGDKPKREPRTSEEMGTLLAKMLGGVDRFDLTIVAWPGRDDVKVGIRLLSDYDIAEADALARAWCASKDFVSLGRDRMDEREFAVRFAAECLARALVDPETKQALVRSADELRKLTTREEIDVLGSLLSDHQESCAPFQQQLSDEELQRLAEALRKGPRVGATVLQRCAPSTLRRLCLLLVAPPEKPTGSQS